MTAPKETAMEAQKAADRIARVLERYDAATNGREEALATGALMTEATPDALRALLAERDELLKDAARLREALVNAELALFHGANMLNAICETDETVERRRAANKLAEEAKASRAALKQQGLAMPNPPESEIRCPSCSSNDVWVSLRDADEHRCRHCDNQWAATLADRARSAGVSEVVAPDGFWIAPDDLDQSMMIAANRQYRDNTTCTARDLFQAVRADWTARNGRHLATPTPAAAPSEHPGQQFLDDANAKLDALMGRRNEREERLGLGVPAEAVDYSDLELPLEQLVDLCNNMGDFVSNSSEVIAAEAALEMLYKARRALIEKEKS